MRSGEEGECSSVNLQWSGDAVQTVAAVRKWRWCGGDCGEWGAKTPPPDYWAPGGYRVWAGGVAWRSIDENKIISTAE